MKLSRLEMETNINFNEQESTAEVYTYNGKMKSKLNALCASRPELVRKTADDGFGGLTFEIPKNLIAIRTPVTEEFRQACKDRAVISNLSSFSGRKPRQTDIE